ncbi:hypothetical protein J0H33_04950 [bacterium]|nr:hypothetical protein [bacterium]
MTGRTSGLQRDVEIVRRRAWVFIPFFVLGLIVAIVLHQRSSGTSSATSTIQLQTSIYDLASGGDQGFKVYDAQAMTRLPEFRQEVIDKIGDKSFDYSRFAIILNPNVTTEGVSSGNLVVTITDASRAKATTYQHAFVDVFTKEFTSPDGLFRTHFVKQQEAVATAADQQYQAAYQKLQQAVQQAGIDVPLSQLANSDQTGGYLDQLAQDRANTAAELARTDAAIQTVGGDASGAGGAVASSVLGQPVAGADAAAALKQHALVLGDAIKTIDTQLGAATGTTLPAGLGAQVQQVRALDAARTTAARDVANAQAAVASAFSSADATNTASGGNVSSLLALVAIVIGVTVVFGLIAIYLLEWLSQLRAASVSEA